MWIATYDAIAPLMKLTIPVGAGGQLIPIWRSGKEDKPDTLLGRPIYFHEVASELGNPGDLMLANWREYLDATYMPFQGISSTHVRYVHQETAFKFWTRNDGQPHWRTPLTPRRSSLTLSPFVTLEARA